MGGISMGWGDMDGDIYGGGLWGHPWGRGGENGVGVGFLGSLRVPFRAVRVLFYTAAFGAAESTPWGGGGGVGVALNPFFRSSALHFRSSVLHIRSSALHFRPPSPSALSLTSLPRVTWPALHQSPLALTA